MPGAGCGPGRKVSRCTGVGSGDAVLEAEVLGVRGDRVHRAQVLGNDCPLDGEPRQHLRGAGRGL